MECIRIFIYINHVPYCFLVLRRYFFAFTKYEFNIKINICLKKHFAYYFAYHHHNKSKINYSYFYYVNMLEVN